ncbi:hypothetical protein HZA56_15590 [Candidatus Poribacteria bacterium]|nr:hypothetical protein [Candidatus Poribacteria bacterium]
MKTKKVVQITGLALFFALLLSAIFTEAFSIDNSGDERDICEMSLYIMSVLGNRKCNESDCMSNSDGKRIFTVFINYFEGDAGKREKKWKPAFKRGYVCENAKYRYVHQEDSLPKQNGALITIERAQKRYEFEFEWGRIIPSGEILLCGQFTGKAYKAGSEWLLECDVIDCSKPPENENGDLNINHKQNSPSLDSVKQILGSEKIPGTRQTMGTDAGGGRN